MVKYFENKLPEPDFKLDVSVQGDEQGMNTERRATAIAEKLA